MQWKKLILGVISSQCKNKEPEYSLVGKYIWRIYYNKFDNLKILLEKDVEDKIIDDFMKN